MDTKQSLVYLVSVLYICIIKIKQQYNGNTEIQQERDHERRMEIIQTLPKILLVFWQVPFYSMG